METQVVWSGQKCSLIELVYHLLVESASITQQESRCVTSKAIPCGTADDSALSTFGRASHCKVYCSSPSGHCCVVGKTCVWSFHVNQEACEDEGTMGKGNPERESLFSAGLHKSVH